MARAVHEYFGRGYYALYRHYLLPEDQTAAEVSWLLRRLRPKAGQHWLDAPCGYGRHLLELRRRRPDLRLSGIDLNADYLRERGLREAAAVVRADLRRLPFADRSFDSVINLLNSFGYFGGRSRDGRTRKGRGLEGDRQVLAEFARVLRPGGGLVLDLANRRALVTLVNQQPEIRYCGGEFHVREIFRWDPETELIHNRTEWVWPGGREKSGYALRLYTPAQIRQMLALAGLELLSLHGDFAGDPFEPYTSDRMLILARRQP